MFNETCSCSMQQDMRVSFTVFSLRISKNARPFHLSSCKLSPFPVLLIPLVGSNQPALNLCSISVGFFGRSGEEKYWTQIPKHSKCSGSAGYIYDIIVWLLGGSLIHMLIIFWSVFSSAHFLSQACRMLSAWRTDQHFFLVINSNDSNGNIMRFIMFLAVLPNLKCISFSWLSLLKLETSVEDQQ